MLRFMAKECRNGRGRERKSVLLTEKWNGCWWDGEMDLDVDKDSDLLEQEQRQDGGYWLDEERNV